MDKCSLFELGFLIDCVLEFLSKPVEPVCKLCKFITTFILLY